MASLHKFTTKEVLNKVLLDSSGNSVAMFSHTTQEALNAVLDSTNSRLNVSLVGGTISGDMTISGDLTVTGSTAITTNEVIQGTSIIDVTNTEAFLVRKNSDAGDILIVDTTNNEIEMYNKVGINTTPDSTLHIKSNTVSEPIVKLENTGNNALAGQLIFLTSGAANDNDDSGVIRFKGMNDAGTPEEIEYATIYVNHDDVSDGTEDATMHFRTQSNGSLATRMKISSGAVKLGGASGEDVQFEGADTFPDITLTGGQARIKYNTSAGNFENGILFDDGVIKFMRETSTTNFSLVLDADSRISLSNNDNGTKNTIFGFNAGVSLDAGSNYNTFIGANVSDASMNDAVNNTGVGYNALSALTSGDNNISIGTESLRTLADGTMNVAIGNSALYSETGGDTTIAIGQTALYSQNVTSGVDSKNVGIGYLASYYNVNGTSNVSIGFEAMKGDSGITTGHSNNIAIGYQSLLNVSTGNENIAIGSSSGKGITTGGNNTYIGHAVAGNASSTGHSNTFVGSAVASGGVMTGNYNVGMGRNALIALTSGSNNVAMGYQSGTAMTNNEKNVVIGFDAFKTADNGENNNVIIGASAGDSINSSDCDNNVIIGMEAGRTGTGAMSHNVVIGRDAMKSIGSSSQTGTVAIGSSALTALTSGEKNTAIGYQAGKAMTTGEGNVALGYQALLKANHADADYNVGIGYGAGSEILNAYYNVLIGYNAGNTLTSGGENTIIGHNCDVASGDNNNNIIIGNNITASDNDNRVFIGNDSSFIHNDFNSNATWTHSSDERQKKEIKDDTLGLDFINDIRPVTYKHKSPSEFPKEWTSYNADDKEPMGGDKIIHGLIAQEVKQALDKQGINTFSGWDEGDDGRQSVSFEAFVLPLIKAVQELSAKVKELESK